MLSFTRFSIYDGITFSLCHLSRAQQLMSSGIVLFTVSAKQTVILT